MYTFKFKLQGRKGWKFGTLESLPYTCCGEPSVAEILAEQVADDERSYAHSDAPPVEVVPVEIMRDISARTRGVGVVALAVVRVDRAYGGPEEGGWYYDDETLVREFIVPARSAQRVRERLERYCQAVNPERRRYDQDWYTVRRDWEPRTQRPHYC